MTADRYGITTPYGKVAGYPLNNGFHTGIDYGCPLNTPVVVNGITIGLSGSTGASTGPHLHVGRWVNGKSTDPGSGGFQFQSAVVTDVGSDSVNGKYVRIQGDGASWVYLHLNKQSVTKGQILEGEDMSLQADLDLMKYKYNESEKALRAREKEADLLKYKYSESEKALRGREAQVADLTHKLSVVQAANGDATKWQTLKTLIKELVS